jgi:hypothetical protein
VSTEGAAARGGTKPRSIAIDLVRVIAVTAVVTRHTWYDPKGIVAQVACPWAIAVFFVLTGYLWSSRKELRDEIDTRATGLLIPYAAWGVLISIPYFIWAYTTPQLNAAWATRLLLADFYGQQLMVLPFSVSWFFTVMFIAVVLLRFLGRYQRRVTWGVLALTVAITVVAPKLLWFLPLGAGLALVCMLFIVLGQEFRRVRDRITRPFLVGIAAIAAGGLAVWLGAAHNTQGVLIEVKLSTYGYPVVGLLTGVVISYGIILVAESIERWIPAAAGPYITEAAMTATFSMFLHPCILFMLGTPDTGRWRDFFIALLVPYVIAVVCLRRGWLPWLTGAPRPPLPVSETLGRVPMFGRAWRAVVKT